MAVSHVQAPSCCMQCTDESGGLWQLSRGVPAGDLEWPAKEEAQQSQVSLRYVDSAKLSQRLRCTDTCTLRITSTPTRRCVNVHSPGSNSLFLITTRGDYATSIACHGPSTVPSAVAPRSVVTAGSVVGLATSRSASWTTWSRCTACASARPHSTTSCCSRRCPQTAAASPCLTRSRPSRRPPTAQAAARRWGRLGAQDTCHPATRLTWTPSPYTGAALLHDEPLCDGLLQALCLCFVWPDSGGHCLPLPLFVWALRFVADASWWCSNHPGVAGMNPQRGGAKNGLSITGSVLSRCGLITQWPLGAVSLVSHCDDEHR